MQPSKHCDGHGKQGKGDIDKNHQQASTLTEEEFFQQATKKAPKSSDSPCQAKGEQGQRCEHDGCTKQPLFNFQGEFRPRLCSDHKLNGMLSIATTGGHAKGVLSSKVTPRNSIFVDDSDANDRVSITHTYPGDDEAEDGIEIENLTDLDNLKPGTILLGTQDRIIAKIKALATNHPTEPFRASIGSGRNKYAVNLQCSRAGESRKNTRQKDKHHTQCAEICSNSSDDTPTPQKPQSKPRRTSLKCGCTWMVRIKVVSKMPISDRHIVKLADLNHCGSCKRSMTPLPGSDAWAQALKDGRELLHLDDLEVGACFVGTRTYIKDRIKAAAERLGSPLVIARGSSMTTLILACLRSGSNSTTQKDSSTQQQKRHWRQHEDCQCKFRVVLCKIQAKHLSRQSEVWCVSEMCLDHTGGCDGVVPSAQEQKAASNYYERNLQRVIGDSRNGLGEMKDLLLPTKRNTCSSAHKSSKCPTLNFNALTVGSFLFGDRHKAKAQIQSAANKLGFLVVSHRPKKNRCNLICSRGGISRKQREERESGPRADTLDKEGKLIKTRNTYSHKCGCDWRIDLAPCYDENRHESKMKVVRLNMHHTNGCMPSEDQLLLARNASGKKTRQVPNEILKFVRRLLPRVTRHADIVKALRWHPLMPRHIPLNRVTVTNMINKSKRLGSAFFEVGEDRFLDLPTHQTDHPYGTESMSREEGLQMANFFDENLSNAEKAKKLAQLFEQWKKYDPDLRHSLTFASEHEHDSQLTGWMFMSSRQRALASKYGRVLFLKTAKSVFIESEWAIISLSIIDQDDEIQMISYACLKDDSERAHEFVFKKVVDWVPILRTLTEVTFTDKQVSEGVLRQSFANLKVPALSYTKPQSVLLTTRAMSKHENFDKMIEIFSKDIQAAKTEDEYDRNFQKFIIDYPGAPANCLRKLHPMRHRYVQAYLNACFTANKSNDCTSYHIQSIMKEIVYRKINLLELALEMLYYEEKSENADRKRIVQSNTIYHKHHLDNLHVSLCKRDFSEFAGCQFSEQLRLTSSFEVINEDDSIFVVEKKADKKSVPTRLMMQISSDGFVKCPCPMRVHAGWPCAHILTVLMWLGQPVYSPLYFNDHWRRRFKVERMGDINEQGLQQNAGALKKSTMPTLDQQTYEHVPTARLGKSGDQLPERLMPNMLHEHTQRYQQLMALASHYAKECSKTPQQTNLMISLLESNLSPLFSKEHL